MTFLDFDIDEKELAAAKFIGETRRGLISALLEAKEENTAVCQASIAREIEMDKGSLSKILHGRKNLTLRTIAEISYALGFEPEVHFCRPNVGKESNGGHKVVCGAVTSTKEQYDWMEVAKPVRNVKFRNTPQSMSLKNAS